MFAVLIVEIFGVLNAILLSVVNVEVCIFNRGENLYMIHIENPEPHVEKKVTCTCTKQWCPKCWKNCPRCYGIHIKSTEEVK